VPLHRPSQRRYRHFRDPCRSVAPTLLAIQPRSFVVTTDSDHELEVYLNIASEMKLTGINQLWVADIAYIRLKTEFVYLALILDGYSRKVVGWALERTLATRLLSRLLSRQSRSGNRRPVWCTIPIAGCSTPPAIT
jgi:transposase InsO family protein